MVVRVKMNLKIKNGLIRPIPASRFDRKIIENDISKILPIINKHNWIVSAGTALGLYREGNFIKHDTDFDIEIFDISKDDSFNLMIELRQKGLMLIRIIQSEDNNFYQQAYRLPCGFIFDIYFYYLDENTTKYINHNDLGILELPKHFVDNKEKDKKTGYYFPQPIEDYLVFRYGENWRVPKSHKMGWENDVGEALVRK
jgi:hypothetical protein